MADGAGACGSVEEFLAECERSGDAAYAAFLEVLQRLEDPATRAGARAFLSDLQRRLGSRPPAAEQCFDRFHFQIEEIVLDQYQGRTLSLFSSSRVRSRRCGAVSEASDEGAFSECDEWIVI
ncbi:hypothetical protein ACJRO7_026330 [Eucalyptus globulus]|uniref:Uncharacterized protein n=1 Tax=Eucalyptus globulus TaxID=34317 RepID=A0ABD3JQA0_EUCGL